ncbi:ATP-dependent RNA helicase HrpA [Methylonatrum kenyense]|uniref:ATP-dependent RNA helicase HrpA n=1 Tax=Methylonatrum kenyense TaxID=455253 RepID=UPI0020C17177|nr:ATP-dependent RNA helicase HrpA [Methylonatrum kenyense]MCK8515674.1 ATP-dependent RNA helicase HrpA [Methylonatrum kenyense]
MASAGTDPDTLPTPKDLEALIPACPPVLRSGFQRRLRGLLRRVNQKKPADRGLKALARDVQRAAERRRQRAASLPVPDFGQDLPVNERRADIAELIRRHQVVVVCGETGSGKSTQLPKICLDLGRGVDGMIAHTQPRRLAARTLANRVADELGAEVGQAVGYKVRFTDQVSDNTHVKLLTDGMLLAEMQGDRELAAYDTIIIDEAHERSLNIDFLLGYLKRLLPRRPDLKVIITSATIDPDRFARHFDDAPVIEVSGRTYPVEVRYRPLVSEDDDSRDLNQREGIVRAVEELSREGPGDILVFLSGEREIREAAEALRRRQLRHAEILPLYARLSAAEQQRIFAQHSGRRVVLSTNVAETSVTVPGIRYVVDTGTARISRYSVRTKVQRLPIEPVSQASANQRAGRCGRVAPGICIRLYSEEDFLGRPAFTDPEIARTNLASVILQMEHLKLGAVEHFPFVEPPDPRYINDGYKLLFELQAVDDRRRLTRLGERLARLPVDPAIGRMLLAGAERGALRELLVICAALTIQDPRERPLEAQQAADQAHARWRDKRSDFLAFLQLWNDWHTAREELSNSRRRAWAREHFLSFVRLRDWGDVYRQLRELMQGMGLQLNTSPADEQAVHRALLSGMLASIATRNEDGDYTGARNLKLHLFPGSGVAKRRPRWIMAAELVETSRVFARTVAEVNPVEVADAASHLVSRSFSDPHWDEQRGQVRAYETVTLYGLVLRARRPVNYGPIQPAEAREVFLRQGLAEDRVPSKGRFLAHNRDLIARIRELEDKSRRRDVLVDVDVLHAFYAQRVPEHVVDLKSFEAWRRKAEKDSPRLLFMEQTELMRHEADSVTGRRFPDQFELGALRLPLEYYFEPGHPDDGVSLRVPIAALNQLDPEPFEWLVPGLLEEKITALIRGLPKSLRRNFVPAPDFARAVQDALPRGQGSLLDGVRRELRRMTGVDVPPEQWDDLNLDPHYRMNFRVVDADGELIARGRDLRDLQRQLAGKADRGFAMPPSETAAWERSGIRRWDFGELPENLVLEQQGIRLQAYPAVVDQGQSVALQVLDSPDKAARASHAGIRRLYLLQLADQARYLRQKLPAANNMELLYRGLGSSDQLARDLVAAVFDRVFLRDGLPRDEAQFRKRLDQGRGRLVEEGERLAAAIARVLQRYQTIQKALKKPRGLDGMESYRDIAEHLQSLVYPGFMESQPLLLLDGLPRYLEGLQYRLDKLAADPRRDSQRTREIRPYWEQYRQRAERHAREGIDDPALLDYRRMLEEFRISLFAQPVGTAVPVSEKRLQAQWKEVR